MGTDQFAAATGFKLTLHKHEVQTKDKVAFTLVQIAATIGTLQDNWQQMKIVCIGDHCCPSILLRELGIKDASLPFDWVSKIECNTPSPQKYCCVDFFVKLIMDLNKNHNATSCAQQFVSAEKEQLIWCPHDVGTMDEKLVKYTRRFERLLNLLQNEEKLAFLVTTRFCEPDRELLYQLQINRPKDSVLLICGKQYAIDNIYSAEIPYFANLPIWQDYDYVWRPQVKNLLSNIFL